MTEQPISPPLRAELAQVYLLGFLDASAGCEVEEEDTISVESASSVFELAATCIDGSSVLIAQLYPENPETVYRTLYLAGYEACKIIEELGRPVEINLN